MLWLSRINIKKKKKSNNDQFPNNLYYKAKLNKVDIATPALFNKLYVIGTPYNLNGLFFLSISNNLKLSSIS